VSTTHKVLGELQARVEKERIREGDAVFDALKKELEEKFK